MSRKRVPTTVVATTEAQAWIEGSTARCDQGTVWGVCLAPAVAVVESANGPLFVRRALCTDHLALAGASSERVVRGVA